MTSGAARGAVTLASGMAHSARPSWRDRPDARTFAPPAMSQNDELIAARRRSAAALSAHGTQAFPNTFVTEPERGAPDAASVDLSGAPSRDTSRRSLFARIDEARLDEALLKSVPEESALSGGEPRYWLFGRVMAKRGPFLVIRTPLGDAQALVRGKPGKNGEPALPAEDAAQLELLDLADHVAVHGPLIRTLKGDLAVRADHYRHVGKAILPPPEKWHGLTDVEKRYRERYVDLFANPDVAAVFRARALVVKEIRRFLDERHFLEVETPLLHSVRGGAVAKPFTTHHNVLDMDLFLRIAPELYLKRLLVGGLDRVYEIGRCFRNEGVSTRHNPEFTMLEFYQAYATYEDLMNAAEAMLRSIDRALRSAFDRPGGRFEVTRKWWTERAFSLEHPFARIDMRDALADRCALEATAVKGLPGTAFDGLLTRETVRDPKALAAAVDQARPALSHEHKKMLDKCSSHGERIFVLYELLVEPSLTQLYRTPDGAHSIPVFVTRHPTEVSPLARKNDEDPSVTDRFELFLEGKEIANAFSELNDPDDQEQRFLGQLARKDAGDEEAMDMDADYVRALRHGMPPAAGFGLGVDRVVMLLTGQPSIRDVLFFPAMRPEGAPATRPEGVATRPEGA
jgi:lysyl-tRNA synthetase, class II